MAILWFLGISVFLSYFSVQMVAEVGEIDLHLFLKPAFIDREGLFDAVEHNQTQPAYMVLGITPTCFVYFGWLHLIVQVHDPLLLLDRSEGRCNGYIPFIIRAQNTNNMLLIAIKRSGRRIMVQSISSLNRMHKRGSRSDAFLIPFKAKARHRQFFSQEFSPGFTYLGAFAVRNRVIIYGYDHVSIVLNELSIMQGDHNMNPGSEDRQLMPYLGTRIRISPALIPPSNIFVREAFDGSSTPNIIVGAHNFMFISKPLNVIRIPLFSLVQGRLRGAQNYQYDGFIFRSEGGNLTAYLSPQTRSRLGTFRVYKQILELKKWTTASLPPIQALLQGYTVRTWMNSYRFHRRMSYPHSIHRSLRHNVFRGWKKFLPAILATLLIFFIITLLIYQIIQVQEKLRSKFGFLSGSQSANSF